MKDTLDAVNKPYSKSAKKRSHLNESERNRDIPRDQRLIGPILIIFAALSADVLAH